MAAYYNEINEDCVAALHELMRAGLIPAGDIDSRSIKDVRWEEIDGYTQYHLFAGIGVWAYSARLAGWPDDRRLWTASCPCQPISNAGKRRGADDPRHLWPDTFRLVRSGRPGVLMGEQVSGALGYGWLDGVFADLESESYSCEAVDVPACSIDAPHIRNRLVWTATRGDVADGDESVVAELEQAGKLAVSEHHPRNHGAGDVGDAESIGGGTGLCQVRTLVDGCELANADGGVDVGDAIGAGLEGFRWDGDPSGGSLAHRPVAAANVRELAERYRGRNGTFWSEHEWLLCHDGKARRTEPTIRLLVDGVGLGVFRDGSPRHAQASALPGIEKVHLRTPLWRTAGNSIVAPLIAEAIRAYMDLERA